jgi:TnpA family transposase
VAALTTRLAQIQAAGLGDLPILQQVHPATRALLASWGRRYDVWSLRRFAAAKRYSIVLCFLQAAVAETLDSIVEMQDKLITRVHNKARKRREEVLQDSDRTRERAVIVLEEIGSLVVDDAIPDHELRARIFAQHSCADLAAVVTECRQLRDRDDGSHLGFLISWYGYTRKYSPTLLAVTPFDFSRCPELQQAIAYLNEVNKENGRRFDEDAPTEFLAGRWEKYVLNQAAEGHPRISRPHYELALLTTLNERLKSGDVSVTASRRWADFDRYLIPAETWQRDRLQHYTALGLPVAADEFIERLGGHLASVTTAVDARMPGNQALTIDRERGEFTLARLAGREESETVEELKQLIESRLLRTDLVDILIELDNETDFLRHFASQGTYETRLAPALHRRNVLAALIAIGCNIGPQRMAAASPGLSYRDISRVADWSFSEETLRAAVIDLVNYAAGLPLSRIYGSGETCSADGMRFYVPVHVLASDYSPLLQGRGVTLLAHTSDHYLRFYQQAIPCKLREATFTLDALIEHDTELDPKTCFTDTHGYTEVVMATAALLSFELAPRIRDIKDQTLYKMDRHQHYPHLDPILTGTIRPHLIRQAWDEVVRVIASMRTRVASPSLILHRLGSYARQNSIYQALAEIGRVYKTVWILRYLDDETLRRRTGRELNKGEASHDLSRFLCFGKEGRLYGREFEDQLHTFSCLAVLHNAVVAWNIKQIALLVERLRAEGHVISDADLALTSPLVRRHINPYGRYHFDLTRLERARPPEGSAGA